MHFLYVESTEDRRQKFVQRFAEDLPGHDLSLANGYASAIKSLGEDKNFFDGIIVNMGCAGFREQDATQHSMGGIDLFEKVIFYGNAPIPFYFFGDRSADDIVGMLEMREIDSRPTQIFTADQEDDLFETLQNMAGNRRPVLEAPQQKEPAPHGAGS